MNQCQQIVDYISKNGSITQAEAFSNLGVSRLASRINDLKKQGVLIFDRWDTVKNRFQEPCRVKRYFIVDSGSQEAKECGLTE